MLQTNKKRAASIVLAIALALTPLINVMAQDAQAPVSQTIPMQAQTMEAYSNRQVHPFASTKVNNQFNTSGYVSVANAGSFELFLNKQLHTLRLRDNDTEYIWGALQIDEAQGLNKSWLSYGNSIAGIECFDEQGVEKRYGISDNATATYEMQANGFTCSLKFTALDISFDVAVTLIGNGLSFSVDEQSISEGDSFKLKSIMFMPYMGSSYSDSINGYILVPDGCGALIRFQKPTSYSSGFAKKTFGKDLSIDTLSDASDLKVYRSNDYIIQDPQILMPVYGIVHGDEQNAFLGVINNGAEYSSIVANPAAPNNPYNWGGVRFEFRQKYNLSTNRKEGSGTIVPQSMRNRLSPSLTLHFLRGTDASYDKMAVYYRNLLFKDSHAATNVKELPIKIEVLGAAKKNNFFKTMQQFSTIENAETIAKDLNNNGITNVSMVLRGFTKNNEAGHPLNSIIGNKKSLQSLNTYMLKSGGSLYFHMDPLSANKSQINLRTEAANNLSNILINIKRPNPSVMYPDNYFYRLSEAKERVKKALTISDNVPLAIDSLGYRLYGDYTTDKQFTRADNMITSIDLALACAKEGKTPFYQPNSYLWEQASEFYDAPLVSSQYLFETDTVPFLQIVLSGKVDVFAQSLNTGTYSKNRLLRMVEYGTYPSFTVTNSKSEALYNTPFEDCFSTNYDEWSASITQSYSFMKEALSSVIDKSIVSHNAISEGFISTEYSGNITIYINYTDKPITYSGATIQPYSYFVNKG